jgi:hypothetical protein
MNKYSDFKRISHNLYKLDSEYFRLFAQGITPNGCWLINPEMHQLLDIEAASGNYIYGDKIIQFDCCGTVPASCGYVNAPLFVDCQGCRS